MSLLVYTDGACRGNPGPGGWAWASDADHFDSGSAKHTTNQRMELRAAMEAVRAHPGELTICSDSTYVVNCFRNRWYDGWLAKGWKNSKREPVANRDLWEPLLDMAIPRIDEITWTWVKGHSGDVMNDLVDRLAVEASHAVDATAEG